MIKTNFLIVALTTIFINCVYAENNKASVLYYPMFQDARGLKRWTGEIGPYPGGYIEDGEFDLEKCKEIVLKDVANIYRFANYGTKTEITGESTIGDAINFCWPSDATVEEEEFFFTYGYISPQTKDKIFPLGERKYTEEPKPAMEIIK